MKFTKEELWNLNTVLAEAIADGLDQFLSLEGKLGGFPTDYLANPMGDCSEEEAEAAVKQFTADVMQCSRLMRYIANEDECDYVVRKEDYDNAALAFAIVFHNLWD